MTAKNRTGTEKQSLVETTLLQKLKQAHLLDKTRFIILFGSVSKGKHNPLSDIDLCVSFDLPAKERLQARAHLLGILPEHYDLQTFEDLPLYMKKSVLAGTLLYCKNKPQLIQRALQVIEDYADFEPIYSAYIAHRKVNRRQVPHG